VSNFKSNFWVVLAAAVTLPGCMSHSAAKPVEATQPAYKGSAFQAYVDELLKKELEVAWDGLGAEQYQIDEGWRVTSAHCAKTRAVYAEARMGKLTIDAAMMKLAELNDEALEDQTAVLGANLADPSCEPKLGPEHLYAHIASWDAVQATEDERKHAFGILCEAHRREMELTAQQQTGELLMNEDEVKAGMTEIEAWVDTESAGIFGPRAEERAKVFAELKVL
jgi:hypothetical protein